VIIESDWRLDKINQISGGRLYGLLLQANVEQLDQWANNVRQLTDTLNKVRERERRRERESLHVLHSRSRISF